MKAVALGVAAILIAAPARAQQLQVIGTAGFAIDFQRSATPTYTDPKPPQLMLPAVTGGVFLVSPSSGLGVGFDASVPFRRYTVLMDDHAGRFSRSFDVREIQWSVLVAIAPSARRTRSVIFGGFTVLNRNMTVYSDNRYPIPRPPSTTTITQMDVGVTAGVTVALDRASRVWAGARCTLGVNKDDETVSKFSITPTIAFRF